jgi:CO/xanthine dehydrogenase Mo-binding subunit
MTPIYFATPADFRASLEENHTKAEFLLVGFCKKGTGHSMLRSTWAAFTVSTSRVKPDLAEYHIPVCADVPEITTILVPEKDTLVNPLGAKGLGELGVVGLTAAVANAVYHATGVRFRRLPIRLDERLLDADAMQADA